MILKDKAYKLLEIVNMMHIKGLASMVYQRISKYGL